MMRFSAFLLFSLAIHGLFAAGWHVCSEHLRQAPGTIGDPDARIFVTVRSREERVAASDQPSSVDAPDSQPDTQTNEQRDKPEPRKVSEEKGEEKPPESESTPEEEAMESLHESPSDTPEFLASPADEAVHDPTPPRAAEAIEEPKKSPPLQTDADRAKGHARKEDKPEPAQHKDPTESSNSSLSAASHESVQSLFKSIAGDRLATFKDAILDAIKRASYYPKRASRKRQHGRTVIAFTITRERTVENLRVVESSGSEVLDKAAKKILEKASGHFPTLPAGYASDRVNYVIPIVFKKRKNRRK